MPSALEVTVVSGRAEELRDVLDRSEFPDLTLRFFTAPAEVTPQALQAEIALGAPDVLAPVVAGMPRLKWVQSTWAGITPFLAEPRRDYLLTGVPGVFGESMAEYALGWMLAFRRSVLAHAQARTWAQYDEPGLASVRLGIAGTGSIGTEVAQRCAPFVHEVVGLNSDGRDVAGFQHCYSATQREAFAKDLDVLLMILPDTATTMNLIGHQVLTQLRTGALLINAGRANSLDHLAMLEALKSKQLGAAVLDVLPQEPLPETHDYWHTPGIYITSHSAAPTQTDAIVALFQQNLARYRQGQPLRGVIDFDRGY